jgi:hypothetical protein
MPIIIKDFKVSVPIAAKVRITGCKMINWMSRSSPIETKKMLLNASFKGTISATTWWLSSVSERIIPAMKAPSAKDKPIELVKYAVPSNSKRIPTVKTSLILSFAR